MRILCAAMTFQSVAIVASDHEKARSAEAILKSRYKTVPVEEADVVVAIGGDGLMLHALHRFMDGGVPIFGVNRGSVGFMMNAWREDGLLERLDVAEAIQLRPLSMRATDLAGNTHKGLAINDVSLLRSSPQTAKIRIHVDGVMRMEELICDGVLVASPAGSTAYNNALGGPILPLGADLLALTPISAFRPRRWRGALLPQRAEVTFEVLEPEKRHVGVSADFAAVTDVASVTVGVDPELGPRLLFDPEHNLEERIIKEQFVP